MNQVHLICNLTRDVELRHTPAGTAVANVGVAVNDRVKRGDEWVEEPTFVEVTVWGRNAEVLAQYCGRGDKIGLDGRLKLEQWEDQEGKKRSQLRVVLERLYLLGGKGGGQKSRPETASERQEEDVPF